MSSVCYPPLRDDESISVGTRVNARENFIHRICTACEAIYEFL